MLRYAKVMALMVMAGAVLALAGCGGGSDDLGQPAAGTASLSGTVYAPAAQVGTAQAESAGPVARCRVEVRTEPGGQRLAWGVTDDAGGYSFRGLPPDVTVIVEAQVPECEPLLARYRLRTGTGQVDVTGASTIACICARYAWAYGPGTENGDQEFAGRVAEQALQFQAQNGYRYRQGGCPDFTDGEAIADAARDLLAVAAGEALEQARQTRGAVECEHAVRMMLAHVCEGDATQLRWSEQVISQIARRLQEGAVNQGAVNQGAVEQAMSRIMNREVTQEQVQNMLQNLWHRLGYGEQSRAPELVEIVGAMVCACGEEEALRVRTHAQLGALVGDLG